MFGNNDHRERYQNLASQLAGHIETIKRANVESLSAPPDFSNELDAMKRLLTTYYSVAQYEAELLDPQSYSNLVQVQRNLGTTLAASNEDSEHLLLRISGLVSATESYLNSLEERMSRGTGALPIHNSLDRTA